MWFLLVFAALPLNTAAQSGSNLSPNKGKPRLILSGGHNNPCHGHVEIYYDGVWGFVGDTLWNRTTEQVVCRSAQCGDVVDGLTEDVQRPQDSKVWLNEVQCRGDERDLSQCNHPGRKRVNYPKETVKKIKCSRQIKFSLRGFKCAGAVRYSVDGKNPTGYICDQTWTKEAADVLCRSRGCKASKDLSRQDWMTWDDFHGSKKMILDCTGIMDHVDHLWQCVTRENNRCPNPATVVCQDHERLQLTGASENVCSGRLESERGGQWIPVASGDRMDPEEACQQMHCGSALNHSREEDGARLTCKDTVAVLLMDGEEPSRCYGAVYVERNGVRQAVSASSWTKAEGRVVCRELKCGNVSFIDQTRLSSGVSLIMDRVQCSGSESSLWHCRAKHGVTVPGNLFSKQAYVICADGADSMKVRLDGPGKCSGRLEVLYQQQWMEFAQNPWPEANSDTVCTQLGCGKHRSTGLSVHPFREPGKQGSRGRPLLCPPGATKVAECFQDPATPVRSTAQPVFITCEEHKVVILRGERTCSGLVGIEKGPETFWLSGSKESWNQESADAVCRQMHCGNASSLSRVVDHAKRTKMWTKSYRCPSGAKSLFQCKTAAKSANHSDTVASVECSESVTMSLSDGCYGDVFLCLEGKCGKVCAASWSHGPSEDLCRNLSCGDVEHPRQQSTHSFIGAWYAMADAADLTESDKNRCKTAHVVCPESIKPRFTASRDRCSGRLEVSYKGRWVPVCVDKALNSDAQNAVCAELRCGRAVGAVPALGSFSSSGRISEARCPKDSRALSKCDVTYNANSRCHPVELQCSDWRKMTTLDTCSGAVLVHTNGTRGAVAREGWTEAEGRRLCRDLNCGDFKSLAVHNTSQELTFWNGSFSCGKDPENIWDCENPDSPPSQLQQLFIQCGGEPKVTLSEECRGRVKIQGLQVCRNNWTHKYSHLVCQEQNCSNAVFTEYSAAGSNAEGYHVSCDHFHHKLGRCRRVQGRCGGGTVSVYCVGNVMFNSSEYCGGELQINYRNKWEGLCPLTLSTPFKDKLCQMLRCNRSIVSTSSSMTEFLFQRQSLETTLECYADDNDVRHCVNSNAPCGGVTPAHIYCQGYEPKEPPPATEPPKPDFTVRYAAVGVSVCLLIVIVIIAGICVFLKVRKVTVFLEKVLSRREEDSESGDYEPVNTKINELDELGTFELVARDVAETDSRRDSVAPYNDIDPEAEPQPPPTPEEEEVVNYEVDDLPEIYDDVDVGPEVTQVQAEVHHCPETHL